MFYFYFYFCLGFFSVCSFFPFFMFLNSLLYFLVEFIDFFKSPLYFFRSVFFSFSIVSFFSSIFSFLYFSFLLSRESSFFSKDVFFYWLLYLFIFIPFSLVIFISEEIGSSLSEVFFESFFITWLLYFSPDFFVFGFSVFSSKFSFYLPFLSLFFFPFINIFSSICKSFIISLRINTNFISGHLLLSLFFVLFEFFLLLLFFHSSFFLIFPLFFIYLLELFVALIQVYVLSLISFLYIKESFF